MALALGVGTEANQPLAIAVIGGLLVSTFFTLVLIPTLYVIFEERFPAEAGTLVNQPSKIEHAFKGPAVAVRLDSRCARRRLF